jgi:hypothetical protein
VDLAGKRMADGTPNDTFTRATGLCVGLLIR